MTQNAFVILNPVAGQSNPEHIKGLLKKARTSGSWRYILYETTGKEDLKQVVRESLPEGFDLVLVCGGDGTVSGVADGLACSDVPMGIMPSGTTNAFATELGIPNSPQEALDLVIGRHQLQSVDAIQSGERYYILEASLGIFSASFEDVERQKKDRLGWLAFVDTAIRNWLGLDPLHVRVEVDGVWHSSRASEIALFNTSQVGIIDEDLDADIHLNDGILDLYALRSKSLWDVLQTLIYRLVGKPKKAPHIRYWEVRKSVKIDSDPTISFQADGDIQGETPALFEVAPGVLKVIVPEARVDQTSLP